MKRLSFLLAGMIAGIAGLMAEQPMWSVSGTVFDFEGEAVAGAMIFAKVDTVSIGSTSDKDGNFFLEFPPADSLCIKAVMTGYKPKEEKIMIAGKSTEIDIVFDERSTKLEEVTVSCENAFVSDNGIKFYPTGYQKSASDDAYSLLNSMQLPGFDIDRHTGAANTRSGSVSYFIDGHPASDEELRSLRPKDVLRVEYYEYPLMQFNMMPNVINYVMKKYDYGGYTTFSGRQSFLNENGDYRTSIRYDKKKMSYTVVLNGDYSDNSGTGINSEENYRLYGIPEAGYDLCRSYEHTAGTQRNYDLSSLLLLQYQSDKFYAQSSAGFSYDKRKDTGSGLQRYSPPVYPDSQTNDYNTGKSANTMWNGYFRMMLQNAQMISGNAMFQYSNSNSYRNYDSGMAGADHIITDAESDAYAYSAQFMYAKAFKNGGTVAIYPSVTGKSSNVDYSGTVPYYQKSSQTDFLLPINYEIRIKNKYLISTTLQGLMVTYSVNGSGKKTEITPSAGIYYNIPFTQRNMLSGNVYYITRSPSFSLRSNMTQQVDELYLLRGNPHIKNYKTFQSYIGYTTFLQNLSLSLRANYFAVYGGTFDTWTPENGMIVHSYEDGIGDVNNFNLSLDANLSLLEKSLVLRGGVKYCNENYTGIYAGHHNFVNYNIGAAYYYKKFSANCNFKSKVKTTMGTGSSTYDYKPSYDLFFTYGNRGWFFEIGCSNVFNRGWYMNRSMDSSYLSIDSYSFSDAMDPQFYVKVSYSFDFGRKLQHTKPIEIDSKIDDGIMMPD